jgi:hypothetical protein
MLVLGESLHSKEILAAVVLFLFAQDYIGFANTKTLPMFTLVCAFGTDRAGNVLWRSG